MDDAVRWKRSREIFDAVVDLKPSEQRLTLAEACGDDRALLEEVESLLAHDKATDDPIAQAVIAAAREGAEEDGALIAGQMMLHYNLTSKIGEGGMGAVWKATDFTLGRDVAIKVLPSDFAQDANRLARFEREAKLLAALNHSNIASVYSLHEDGGRRFLAMEYVDGHDLSERIARGPMPVDQVLAVAVQIAAALEEAHEKGIVHRDLKPANVKLKADGKVKVLDFGLAKGSAGDGSDTALSSSALVAPLASTRAGVILGTAAYMPPEQARGLPVDKRADIWAFGVMLFEMLSGRRPFDGPTLTDVLAAVITAEPDLTLLPAATPAPLLQLIVRCLQKDTRQRLRDIGEARIEIERLLRGPHDAGAPVVLPRRRLVAWAGAAVALIAVAFGIGRGVIPDLSVATPSAGSRSIAVLPLIDLSPEQDQEYFADGLTEELLGLLGKNTQLRVAGRTSVFRFKNTKENSRAIGRALGVSTLLEGSVRRSGNRARIAVQLINAEDGFQIWADSYDRTMDDMFAVQQDIARAVTSALQVAMLAEAPNIVRPPVASGPVYSAYLKGKYFLNLNTKEGVEKATGYFSDATQLNPAFAPAWAGLSRARAVEGSEGFKMPSEVFDQARRAGERAVALNPRLAEGHLALSWVRRAYDWDWAGADAAAQRALQLEPNNADIVMSVARMASTMGRQEEALALSRRAASLDPLNVQVQYRLARYEYFMGQLDASHASFVKVIELNSQYPAAHQAFALVLLAQGQSSAAIAELAQEPIEYWRAYGEALLNHRLGRRAEADAALTLLIDRYNDAFAFQIAHVYAERGQLDETLVWLERAYQVRDTGLSQLKSVPEFRRFEHDPRYRAFLDTMALPY
ncbi:MAG: protein kinase [Vicinamibacterales bacterium]